MNNTVYQVIGEKNQHNLACNINTIKQINDEIERFIAVDKLDILSLVSFTPGRLKGTTNILKSIFNSCLDSCKNKESSLNTNNCESEIVYFMDSSEHL